MAALQLLLSRVSELPFAMGVLGGMFAA